MKKERCVMSDKEQMFENRGASDIEQRSALEQSRKAKKAILTVFGGVVLFIVFFSFLFNVIDLEGLLDGSKKDTYNPTNQTIIFFTPDYDEDIYQDSEYMSLDRNIYIYDIDTGVTESIESEDLEGYGDGVKFVVDLVNSIIAGNAELYNDFFSDECFYNDLVEEKEAFTMQKLYNIKITCMNETDVSDNTQTYRQYEIILEYMIRNNNGTFRTDIGSDASKMQYLVITDRSGELLIENILYPTHK